MHVRSSQIARLEIAHKGNSNQQRQRQHSQHWYKNKFEMLEHEHDDSGYKYSPRLGIQHKPKLNASTTYCSYLYAVWMKDGIGAILFWLTIMMLLFKNFPQDEPIIIIIFDNRQIELHYHPTSHDVFTSTFHFSEHVCTEMECVSVCACVFMRQILNIYFYSDVRALYFAFNSLVEH